MDTPRTHPLDPGRVLEDLRSGRAVEDDEVLAILAEVADAVVHADAHPASLSPDLRAALEEAWLAAARARVPAPVVGTRARAPRPPVVRRLPSVRTRRSLLAAAAVLLAGLGAGLLFQGRASTAGAGLDLRVVTRRGGGRPRTSFGGRLRAGEVVEVAEDEEAVLRLGNGNVLALSKGGRLDVLRVVPARGGRVRLELRGGVLVLDAVASPLEVRGLPGGTQVDVLEGRVRIRPGASAARLLLGEGARARVSGRWGRRLLGGPGKVVLDAGGAREVPGGEAEPWAFRALDARRAARAGAPALATVASRRWRVADGRGRRRGGRLWVEPDADGKARVAYAPSSSGLSTGSRGIELALACPAPVRVEVRGGGQRLGSAARMDAAGGPLRLALDEGWASRLEGGELSLVLTWPEGRSDALVFEGAIFREHLDPGGVRSDEHE